MSRNELSRLIGDALADQEMIREAMTFRDRTALESYVRARGYELTSGEVDEVWDLASRVRGRTGTADAARWRMNTVGGARLVPAD